MTNHDNYKVAFNCINAPQYISLIKIENKNKMKVINIKKMAIVLACSLLIISLTITAYANYETIKKVFIAGSNLTLISHDNENGDESMIAVINTDELIEPVKVINDRYIFLVNNEKIDITEEIKENDYYQYEYTDSEGYEHLWIVGLVPNETNIFGFAEYVKDSNDQWMTGYSAKINIEPDGSTNCQWLEKAKEKNEIPW